MNRTQIKYDTDALIGATIEAVVEANTGDELLIAVSGQRFVIWEASCYDHEEGEAMIHLKQNFWREHYDIDDLRKVFDATTCDAWEASDAEKIAASQAAEEAKEREQLAKLLEKYKDANKCTGT